MLVRQVYSAVGATLLLLLLQLTAVSVADEDATTGAATAVTLSATAAGVRRLVKRAPVSSFIGMRGKKQQEASEDNWPQLDGMGLDYGDDSYYQEHGQRYKKAPLAFVGVRGKKYTMGGGGSGGAGGGNNRLDDLLQSIEEQSVRKHVLQDLLDRLAANSMELGKRAPTGFTGMRGKRTYADADDDEVAEPMLQLQKRAPVNAFVGVRGKKDVLHQHYKREALSEAYDVRGKKQRYSDFNNKFVAVRGKKSNDNADYTDADADMDQLVQPAYVWSFMNDGQYKRAPNGFVGMRGKRPALLE